MSKAAHFSSEEKNNPILIVDKFGILGSEIAFKLSEELLVVLVSARYLQIPRENIIHVPYSKKFPVIPDNIYSHIILVDEGDLGIEESISTFTKKSIKDDASLIYISYLSDASLSISEKITAGPRTKAIVYGDIFGEKDGVLFDNKVNSILLQASKNKKIKIPGDGLAETYPVLLEDVLEGTLKAIFSQGKSKIYFIFPRHPLSLISLSHILQKKDPGILIDFSGKENGKNVNIASDGEFLLPESYKAEDKIKEIVLNKLDFDITQKPSHDLKISVKKPKLNYLYFIIFLLFILFLPLLLTGSFLSLGLIEISSLKENLEKGNVANISQSLNRSSFLFSKASGSARVFEYEAQAVGLNNFSSYLSLKIQDYKQLIGAADKGVNAFLSLQKVLEGKSLSPKDDIANASSDFIDTFNRIEEIKLNKRIDKKILAVIDNYSQEFSLAHSIISQLTPLINPEGKRDYLVLFQNNMELRPGGGFIGSYGILSFNRGKFIDFSVNDVYDADGQLKGHIEPPYPIRRYIPQVHWYLRDSNFDVDFTKSASASALFLYQETGKKVDGVIGADVSFVKDLIGAIGEINVPEYKEKVNESNFFTITESHVEKNNFPSSTQKKDFLNALFSALKNKLSEKNLPYPNMLKAIAQAISQKHILFAFSDRKTQSIFSVNNLSSDIIDNRKNNSFNDYLGINEANLGVNKANYFISRKVKYEVNVKNDGIVKSKAILELKNNSDQWPGGDYKVYIRFVLPLNSFLSSVSIDNVSQKTEDAVTDAQIYENKNFRPPQGLEIEKYDENGKTVFGFLTIVPSKKTKTISVEYILAQKYQVNKPSSVYSLKIFKQPGTDEYPFGFKISYPSTLSLLKGQTFFSKTLKTDEDFSATFSRK